MNSLGKLKYIFSTIQEINDEPSAEPGYNRDEIVTFFNKLGLSPNKEIIDLYSWHNGIWNLNAFVHFYPLDDSLSTYNVYKELKNDVAEFNWKPTYFPIIDSNGDTQICYDFETRALISIDMECDYVVKVADDYKNYIDCFFALFDRKLYRFDQNSGSIEIDKESWLALSKEFSVKSMWAEK